MWRPDDPQGNESGKIAYELIRWTRGRGLDVGCGPWKAFPHFIGVDSQPFQGVAVISDALKLDMFAPESMDFIYSSHLLEHIPDTVAALKHWWNLIKVGGFLVLYLPHKKYYPNIGQPGANPDHKHDFLPEDILRAMKQAAPDWDCRENQERPQNREYSFFQVFEKLPRRSGQREGYKKPRPAKMACVVRYGAYGDGLWASSILPHLKKEGYHITMMVNEQVHEVLKHDPHIDDWFIQADSQVPDNELLSFWLWHSVRYDKWVNLVQSVEARTLPQMRDVAFYWPDGLRSRHMNVNYLETVHDFADAPNEFHQKFYPTEEEVKWAKKERASYKGPVVVLNPSGSSLPKFWPYADEFMALMAEQGVHTVLLGDLRQTSPKPPEKFGHVIGLNWPIRKALAFALQADVVVGTESAIVNAVAFEDMLKIVFLSHSSIENLTKHWKNVVSAEPTGLPCYPCHRIHMVWHFCFQGEGTKYAACQAAAKPEPVRDYIMNYLKGLKGH